MSERDAADAHPEAGSIQGGENQSDESGLTVEDAVASSFDDWDRGENGIAEGEREGMGKWLKGHADHAGTSVSEGLGALVQTAAVLRNSDQQTKREMLGHLADTYDIRPFPSAEEQAPQVDEFGDPVGQHPQPALTEDQAAATVSQFVAANPVCEDETIARTMIEVAAEMRRQGLVANLPTMLHHAPANDPRYSEAARATQESAHTARARAAAVQVSGGGSVTPSGGGDDVGDILDELVPR